MTAARTSRIALYLLLLAAPTLAALRDDLSSHAGAISDAEALLERQNHGRQLIFQLSEHAVEELLLDYLREDPDALIQEADEDTRDSMGMDYRAWVSGLDVTIREDNVLAVDARVAGRLWGGEARPDVTCAFGLDDEDQRVRVLLDLTLETDDCGVPVELTVAPSLDLVDLDLSRCSALFAAQEATFEAQFAAALQARLEGFVLPLDELSNFVSEESFTCEEPAVTLPELRPFNAAMRTLTAPLDADGAVTEPLILIGLDLLGETAVYPTEPPDCDGEGEAGDPEACAAFDAGGTEPGLPACYEDVAASGTYDLFASSAFETYNQSLIAADHDLTISVSTRLLRRLYEDLFWRYDDDGKTVRERWEETLDDVREEKGRLVSHSEYSRWEGFTTKTAIADPEDGSGLCDGEPEGAWVLDPDEQSPWLVSYGGLHHRYCFVFCTDTYVSFRAAMRFFIDNADPEVPTLRSDLVVSTRNDAGCGSSCSGSADETDRKLEDLRRRLRSATTQFFDLEWHRDRYSVTFDMMQTYAGTVAMSGKLHTLLLDDDDLTVGEAVVDPILEGRTIPPPIGAIVAFNLDDPGEHLLAQGFDPVQGMCPPGYQTRWLTMSGWGGTMTPSFCEYADEDAASDPSVLPPFAWCGMDVIKSARAEVCDGLDNDGDGRVDEDFVDADDDGVADCLASGDGLEEFVSRCGTWEPREGCPDGFSQYGVWLDYVERACLRGTLPGPCEVVLEDAELITCIADGAGYTDDMGPWLPPGLVIAGQLEGAAEPLEGFSDCPAGTTSASQRASSLHGVRYEACIGEGWWPDGDGDGAPRVEEDEVGTSDTARSTDGDAFPDGFELHADLGLDPLSEDSDGDRLSDLAEILVFLTDPAEPDTDGDGLTDGYEVWVMGYDPMALDTDADGVPDGEEDVLVLVDLYDDWFFE